MRVPLLAAAMTGAVLSPTTHSADTDPENQNIDRYLENITIIGSRENARALPGSGAVIGQEQIEVEVATDINQLMKTIPGTYIREEDGQGLRPNIGIRAASPERSSKITVMEDGVMMAPAPYSNPAAYYFPSTMRMSTVEVLKGAPLLRHGPQTTGGVVNLVSTPIPETRSGSVTATFGEDGQRDVHAHYGGTAGNFGWLVETMQRETDGFKDIDRSNRDTGHDIEDYVVKLGWENERQRVLFKAQYSEEVSDETYLGLTDADFDRDENRRYGLSEIDQMDNQHDGYSLTYGLDLTDTVSVTATGYYNEFARDWFKLSGGNAFIRAANAGDTEAQGILDGTADVAGLQYKHNNRSYESRGVELNFDIDLGAHQLEIGSRIHEDEMDRFQPIEIHDQMDGSLVFRNIVEPTGGNNRLEEGEALTFWATDNWQVTDALKVNLALRHENVETSRDQFADPERSVLDGQRGNDNDEWLPGASFTYDLDDSWQVLAGVHRGFSPLGGGARANEEPETSINYEAGARFQRDGWFLEAIGFYSDFDNKTENCSVGNACSNGATSGSFTTGEAEVRGLEFQASTTFNTGEFSIPLSLSYTLTDAELSADNPAEGFFDGDTLADIPENTLSLRMGLESRFGWNNHLVAKYVDDMCVDLGCNRGDRFDETESLFVVDYTSRYQLLENAVVFLKVENLFDEQSIVSREPDGARPNKPRTASVGLQFDF